MWKTNHISVSSEMFGVTAVEVPPKFGYRQTIDLPSAADAVKFKLEYKIESRKMDVFLFADKHELLRPVVEWSPVESWLRDANDDTNWSDIIYLNDSKK